MTGVISLQPDNETTVEFSAKSVNESYARMVAAAFVAQLDPSIGELTDIKTAVSEAVTNAIIHGYDNKGGIIRMNLRLFGRTVTIEITDNGKGISDIELAKTPLFTGRPDMERTGMGFTIMESFMDSLEVHSKVNEGTRIVMTKKLSSS